MKGSTNAIPKTNIDTQPITFKWTGDGYFTETPSGTLNCTGGMQLFTYNPTNGITGNYGRVYVTENTALTLLTAHNNVVNRVANLESSNKPTITSISETSTDSEIPTAKAVYDYIDEMINGALEESY